jgi:hypothetical protein
MEELHRIKEMLYRELKEYAHKNELSASARVDIHMLTDTLKNIYKIGMFETLGEGDASYEPGESYADRSGRRDARGRYSRDDGSHRGGGSYAGDSYARGSYDGGSYDGGYSGRRRRSYADGKEEVHQMMREAMEAAQDPEMREKIRQCMEQLEK